VLLILNSKTRATAQNAEQNRQCMQNATSWRVRVTGLMRKHGFLTSTGECSC